MVVGSNRIRWISLTTTSPAGVIDDALNWMPCASLLYSLDANAVAESVQTLRWGAMGQVV